MIFKILIGLHDCKESLSQLSGHSYLGHSHHILTRFQISSQEFKQLIVLLDENGICYLNCLFFHGIAFFSHSQSGEIFLFSRNLRKTSVIWTLTSWLLRLPLSLSTTLHHSGISSLISHWRQSKRIRGIGGVGERSWDSQMRHRSWILSILIESTCKSSWNNCRVQFVTISNMHCSHWLLAQILFWINWLGSIVLKVVQIWGEHQISISWGIRSSNTKENEK